MEEMATAVTAVMATVAPVAMTTAASDSHQPDQAGGTDEKSEHAWMHPFERRFSASLVTSGSNVKRAPGGP